MMMRIQRIISKLAFRVRNQTDTDFVPTLISGVAGSGTTLLSALLHQRYQTAANARESARWALEDSVLYIKPIADYPSLDNYFEHLFFSEQATTDDIREQSITLYRSLTRWPKLSNVVLDKAPNTHLARAGKLHAAFPESKFVLIVRDPVSNIEGLRRKWPLFGRADLGDVCHFWVDLHRVFLKDTTLFRDKVKVTTYEDLVKHTDAAVAEIAAFLELDEREDLLPYPDIDSVPGKGLRNVNEGQIQIDRSANADAVERISAEEADRILQLCGDFYKELSDT